MKLRVDKYDLIVKIFSKDRLIGWSSRAAIKNGSTSLMSGGARTDDRRRTDCADIEAALLQLRNYDILMAILTQFKSND
jgi:hypothetical protein